MTKKLLIAFVTGLLSTLALACGDAGEPFEGERGFGEEAVGEPDENLGEEEGEEGEDGNDPGFEENEEEDEEDPEPETPFCGDGFLDVGEECDDGNGVDGDGCSAACELEPFEGSAEGSVLIDLIVDDLNSNEEPLQQDCSGDIEVQIANGVIVGDGRCFLPANFMDYTIDATVDDAGDVQGEIIVTLNNRPHVLPLQGSFIDGALSLAFDGVTILVGNIRGVWDGTIEADFN
jgi:cysteine-rich repeat protein